jgi:hypothetical protein
MGQDMSVWSELKRRKVIRVAAAYAIGSWLLLQLTDVLRGLLELPHWIGRIVVLFVVVGFPAVLTIAWVFEITADGMVRDRRRAEKWFGVRADFVLLGTVLLLSGWLLYKSGPVDQPRPSWPNRKAIPANHCEKSSALRLKISSQSYRSKT